MKTNCKKWKYLLCAMAVMTAFSSSPYSTLAADMQVRFMDDMDKKQETTSDKMNSPSAWAYFCPPSQPPHRRGPQRKPHAVRRLTGRTSGSRTSSALRNTEILGYCPARRSGAGSQDPDIPPWKMHEEPDG